MDKSCPGCGNVILQKRGGAERIYCSEACGARVRRAARRTAIPVEPCKECGGAIHAAATGRPAVYCSTRCKTRANNRKRRRALPPLRLVETKACARCGADFESSRRSNIYCSKRCANAAQMAGWRERDRAGLGGSQERACAGCGQTFQALTIRARFCSQICRNRHHGLVRARQFPNPSRADYTDRQVFERDDWTCHLCGGSIDPALPRLDAMGATIDHLIPLARGGVDELANVAAAHWSCNRAKGDRVA